MTTITIQRPKLHSAQRQVWDDPTRFHVMACGRRFGKSRMGSLLCVDYAIRGKRAWWVAPSYPMASIGWRMLKRLAIQIPGAEVREVDRIITMPTGGTIQVRSADNPDSLRGEGLDYLVMDECAFIKEDAWTQSLRPALADRQGRALFISTPKGRNWFWRAWMRSESDPEWRGWQFPTSANPFIVASEIEAARQLLPERIFRQEFLAEFIDDAGGVFRHVMDAATATRQEQPTPGHAYVFGVDWGKHNDWTVITVLDITDKSAVYVDRFNQIDYTLQAGRLKALAGRFQPVTIIAESNSIGEPVIEQLRRDGLPVQPFQTTNATKTAAIDALALAFEQDAIRIVNDPVLVGELQAYEMERLPSGLLRYSAPEGMHDDCVMSLAIGWTGVTNTPWLLW